MRNMGRRSGTSEPAETGFALGVSSSALGVDASDTNRFFDISISHKNRGPLPASLTFPTGSFQEIDFWYEPRDRAVWCMMQQTGVPSFTHKLMSELTSLHARISQLSRESASDGSAAPLFYVGGSRTPGVFNLGGDLQLFLDCIRRQDADTLRRYANACVRLVHEMDYSLHDRVFTICLLEGAALGGGFEAAISFNYLVAERGVKMGLPEASFHSFPGMGAYSHLARRIGPVQARKMILSGRLYDAEEMLELGIVDEVVDKGRGQEAVRNFLSSVERKHAMLIAMGRVRRRISPVSIEELLDVTEMWVQSSMQLSRGDLRRMELLAAAQERKVNAARARSPDYALQGSP